MNINEIQQVVDLMKGSGVSSFEFNTDGFTVKVQFSGKPEFMHNDLDDLVVTDSKELSQDDLLFYSSE